MNPFRTDYRPARDLPAPTYRSLSTLGPVAAACLQLGWFIANIAFPIPATVDVIHPAICDLANEAQIDPEAENRFPELVEALREFDELRPDTLDGENAAWILPEDRTPAEHEAVAQLQADLRALEQSGIISRIEELITHPNLANTYAGGLRADGTSIPTVYWTLEELGTIRAFVTLQVTHAKLDLQDGQIEKAAEILARNCYAALYLSRQSWVLEHLVGYACASVINEAIVEVATDPRLNVAAITRLIEANQHLQKLGSIEVPMEGERLQMIDMQNHLHDRWGNLIASRLIHVTSGDDDPKPNLLEELIRNPVPRILSLIAPQRDLSISVTNVLFQLLDKAHRTQDQDERERLLSKWDNTIYDIRLNFIAVSIMMPALDRSIEVATRINAAIQATNTILAMAQYRLDHANWPETLDQLIPDYLDAIPMNPVTGDPLEYTPTEGEAPTLESFGVKSFSED